MMNKKPNKMIICVLSLLVIFTVSFTNVYVYAASDNDHMLLGNPSGATTSTSNSNNYLMIKPQYDLSYNNSKRQVPLSGNIYCGHCNGRLTATTSGKKITLADGTVKGKKRNTYVCYKVVKSLSGTSKFPQELLNKLIAQKTESVNAAKSEIGNLQTELAFSEKLLGEVKEKYATLLSWAEMFDHSSPEAKKMIVSYLVNRVTVRKDYDITIEFNADVEQFNLSM